jgi:transcriptional regulator with XRE-family HTH domain
MAQTPRQQGQATRRVASRTAEGEALMRAKMELVAARERGEASALARLLAAYPAEVAELTEFSAALVATTGYERETPTPWTEGIAARARARALAAVFPQVAPATVAQQAYASLKALRKAKGLTPGAVAKRLGLGVDVLSGLEDGLIRVASIPPRFLRALSDALNATAEQISGALQTQAALVPALLRSTEGATKRAAAQPELDFSEAVRLSPNMSDEQKASWLEP